MGYHALHDSHATQYRDAGSLTYSIYLSIYQAGVAGLRAGGLAAASSADADVRADLFDLLDLLVEHRVLVRF